MSVFGDAFGGVFGAVFGALGEILGPGPEAIITTPVADDAEAKLVEQLKDRSLVVSLARSLVSPVQPLADALNDLFTKRGVNTATGVNLDTVGKVVGQARNGVSSDPTYRRYVRGRVATNRSGSRFLDATRVARLILGDDAVPGTQIATRAEAVATLVVDILGVVPGQDLANVIFAFLSQARAGGVRLILETLTALEDSSFTTAQAAFLSGSHSPGSTVLVVNSTAGFPASGALDVDLATGVSEQVTYDGVLSNQFLNVSATASAHSDGAVVQLADDGDRGFAVVAYVDSGAASIGDTALNVDTTAGFPSSGSLDLFAVDVDPEVTTPLETVTYVGKFAASFTGVSALTHNYAENAIVRPHAGTRGGHLVTAQDAAL